MLRTVGILLLCGTVTASGFLWGRQEKKRLLDTLYIHALIDHLDREMKHTSKALHECYASFSYDGQEECTTLLKERHFQQALESLRLSSDIKKKALHFFIELGKGDPQEEASRCHYMLMILEEEEAFLKKTVKERVTVARTVGACIGGVLLLLLW